ncbi:alpha/beta fold hydrolase [Rhodovulum sp. DZ06]|uniref:alpha/beta fold hydrolase n=1 Tax=Rhodovulum sp. DZ06 TaxID=3425126 RepID=UPI003D3439EF
MHEIQVNGRNVGFIEAGAGAEGAPVLFAHCSLARAAVWKPMMEALAPERPSIAFDLPAHGPTEGPAEGVSLQRHAVAIAETLAERAGRKVHLVGLSLGAAVLGRVAAERPDLVVSAALAEPIWFHLLRPAGRIAEAEEEERSIAEVGALREAEGPEAEVRAFMERWGVPGMFDKLRPEARAGACATFARLSADFGWVAGWPEGQIGLDHLAAMQVPTLVFAGETSPRPAAAAAEVVAGTAPNARLHRIAGAGHLGPITHWQDVLAELRGFWAEVEQPEPVGA